MLVMFVDSRAHRCRRSRFGVEAEQAPCDVGAATAWLVRRLWVCRDDRASAAAALCS